MVISLSDRYKDESIVSIIRESSKISCISTHYWRDFISKRNEIIRKFIDDAEVDTMEAYNDFCEIVKRAYLQNDPKVCESLSIMEGVIYSWFYYLQCQGYGVDPMEDFDDAKH